MHSSLIAWIMRAIPFGTIIMYGALGETVTEKSGNLNLGVPGIMYLGGFAGFASAWAYENTAANPNGFVSILIAMSCAILASMAGGLIYAFLTISLRANQNVTGLALTTFGMGVANFFGVFILNGASYSAAPIANKAFSAKLPVLSGLGALGQTVFSYGFLAYAAIALAVVLHWFLTRTRAGLNLRAVGENPATADAAGINVTLYKYLATCIGAAIAGVPGAVIGGRKKVKSKEIIHDDRHLYVTIESPQGGQSVNLNPDLEQQARSLAAQVPGCINQYQGLVQDIPPKIKALKAKLEEAEKDEAVSLAQGELDTVLDDTERLEAARQARDEAKQRYRDEKKQTKTPLFGSRVHGDHDGAGEAEEPLDDVTVSEVEQVYSESPAEAVPEQRGKGFSRILWKVLGLAVIALGVFFLLGMLGGILDGYGIAFVLVCLGLGCGLVYLGIRLMRRGKAKS